MYFNSTNGHHDTFRGGNWTPSQKSLYLISYVSAIGWNALRRAISHADAVFGSNPELESSFNAAQYPGGELKEVPGPTGLEPVTTWLWVRCLIPTTVQVPIIMWIFVKSRVTNYLPLFRQSRKPCTVFTVQQNTIQNLPLSHILSWKWPSHRHFLPC